MIRLEILTPVIWEVLGAVLRLDGNAFVEAVAVRPGAFVALAIVLAAGFSESLGQCIVLFANRVKPARFLFSLLVDALLFTFGYGFLVLSTWTVTRLPGAPNISLHDLALVFALSYAPMLFSFLGALPYFGQGLIRMLRVWHLLAIVVGVAAVARVDVFLAATYVWLGWLVMVLAQRSFGKPIANFGSRLLDAVAGVRLIENAPIAIGRLEAGSARTVDAPRVAVGPSAAKHPARWIALVGLGGIALLSVMVALALAPVRDLVFGWQEHLPAVVRLPFDLLWLAVIALVVAAFMAPLETLGWWAGWYGDDIDTSEDANPSKPSADGVARYAVYLDGIAQSSGKYTPDIETFLDALSPELPQNVRLVRGVMSYSVLNKPLDDDPILSPLWKFVEGKRSKNLNSLWGMLINLRNVTIVAVSSDPRYGVMYNFGMADVIYKSLIANGYPKNSGIPVTLLGYSGGGQMACGAASFLKRALDAPVDVISLGGVISGTDPILDLEHLFHLVGDKDMIERIGPVMFSSRWPVAVLSYWNRAKRLGCLTEVSLGPVAHQVPGGMLDPHAVLPDGRTFLRQTLDYIESIVTDRFIAKDAPVKKPSSYDRYLDLQGSAIRNPLVLAVISSAPVAAPAGFVPVSDWIGRLILPARDERFSGAWFEVQHAPAAYASSIGLRVRLTWSDDRRVRDRLRAVVRDVNFSAEAQWASTYGGLIMPVRLNRWRLVDPLESLAGAHPIDDVVVKLVGTVDVCGSGTDLSLKIEREPVQITGRYYGLVRFCERDSETADGFTVQHFDRNTGTFGGEHTLVRLPPAIADCEGRMPSVTAGIERSPLNEQGWYVYGTPDGNGTFIVQSLAPRELLRADVARTPLATAKEAYRFARRDAWREIAADRGTIVAAQMAAWEIGEKALLLHSYGGIGGEHRERETRVPWYFGHFSFGIAEVVEDAISREPRFEITYYQVYAQNTDGVIAGKLDWSRYMGDRQFGWAGLRPVCDALLRHDGFTGDFQIDGTRRESALDALTLQLEAMTARYRIGDGTGGTFVGVASNCAQDSNRALFGTLHALQQFVEEHPAFDAWVRESPDQFTRYRALAALARDLRKKLQPFGTPRRDWSENEYNLGSTMEDAPLGNVMSGLVSWRCLLPRLAFDTIAGTFLHHGAQLTILGTDRIGGERHDVEPIVPIAL